MAPRSIPFLALFFFASGSAVAALHGIRNEKCAIDEASARADVLLRLATDRKLCEPGMTANQSGGWSCRAGRGCPKTKFRCQTQYACGARVPPAAAPLPHPTGAATKNRELRDGGMTYIEETVVDDQGRKTTVVRPKTAKDDLLPATPVAATAPKPSETPTGTSVTASATPTSVAKLRSLVRRGGSTTGAGEDDLVEPIRVPGALLRAIEDCRPEKGRIEATAAQGGPMNAEIRGKVDGKCRLILTRAKGGAQTCSIPDSAREDFAAGGSTLFMTTLMDPSICALGGP